MRTIFYLACCGLLAMGSWSCGGETVEEQQKTFSVTNNLDQDRTMETVAISLSEVDSLVQVFGVDNLLVKDLESGNFLVIQPIDNDGDKEMDELLFQTDIPAGATKQFAVVGSSEAPRLQPSPETTTFSRFVPERTDDYTWENDRVAFRTYGPEAQRMVEVGEAGGTLSSGIDCWLKRVDYPVIDKWYKGHVDSAGYYHVDRGEGYDPYHVGGSRGTGGIGIWLRDSFYVSRNFTDHKTLATGPIRTLFELTYAPWTADSLTITETKRISLDLGSQLNRVEEIFGGEGELPEVTIGLTLHDKRGEVKANEAAGWYRYWEPVDTLGSMMGVGVVIDPARVGRYEDYRVETPDKSHIFIHTQPNERRLTYYAGFAWDKAGKIDTAEKWDAYLTDFARRVASPLTVKFD